MTAQKLLRALLGGRLPIPVREPFWRHRRRQHLTKTFRERRGRKINRSDPTEFTEKVLLRVLQDRPCPLYELTENKLTAPWFAASRTALPLHFARPYGFWRNPTLNDLIDLPSAFVLKATHSSNMVEVIPDRSKVDLDAVLVSLSERVRGIRDANGNRFNAFIMAEEFLSNSDGAIPDDLKFHCFNGRNGSFRWILEVVSDRFGERTQAFFDDTGSRLPCNTVGWCPAASDYVLPKNLELFAKIAHDLSFGFDYMRIDLYDVDGNAYFGEFTPTHGGGQSWLIPSMFEKYVGDLWEWNKDGMAAPALTGMLTG